MDIRTTERQDRYVKNLFDGLEKDEFKGREYTVAYPEEGDIVRINLHKQEDVFINSRWGRLEKLRDHFVLMWPSRDRVHMNGYTISDHQPSYIVNCYSIDLGGRFGWGGICYVPERDIVVKPTMTDLFEFSDGLRMAGKIYDRDKKIIINKK
jgi:uncharacterized protein (DUF2249 family)